MKKWKDILNYFRGIAENGLKDDITFFEDVDAALEANYKYSIAWAMEDPSWKPEGVDSDNPNRKVFQAFQLMMPVNRETNKTEVREKLMILSDQVFAKLVEDRRNWNPQSFDFIRDVDLNSFDCLFIAYPQHSDQVVLRCEFEFMSAPNFIIDPTLWQ